MHIIRQNVKNIFRYISGIVAMCMSNDHHVVIHEMGLNFVANNRKRQKIGDVLIGHRSRER